MKIIDCIQGSDEWWQARKGRPTASEFDRIGFGERHFDSAELAKYEVHLESLGSPAKLKTNRVLGAFVEISKANLKTFGDLPKTFQELQVMSNAVRYSTTRTELLNRNAKRELSEGAQTYAAELAAETLGWAKTEFKGSPDIERGNQLESMARSYLAFELGQDISEVGICLSDCERYAASPDGLTVETIPVELKCPDQHTQIKYLMNGGGLPPQYKAQVHGQMIVTGAPYAWFCAYVGDSRIPNILEKVERDDYTEELKADVEEFCDRLEAIKDEFLTTQAA